MTTPRPSITWPLVALVGLILSAFVAIFALIPSTDTQSRSVLLAIVTAAGNGIVLWFVSRTNKVAAEGLDATQQKLDGVQRLVNGHTSAILEKIPDATDRAKAQALFERLQADLDHES